MTVPPSTSGWTLQNIILKARAVTGTPSTDQLSDAQMTAYANNYLTFTMPFELKNQVQNRFLQFKTAPGQNVYAFPGTFLTDSPGAYADGFPLIFYEDPDIFFQDWPQQYGVDQVATGTGSISTFAGRTQAFPVVPLSFFITDGLQILQDIGFQPITTTIDTGNGGTNYSGTLGAIPVQVGTFMVTTPQETFTDLGNGTLSGSAGGNGTINYTSGAWTLSFFAVLAVGVPIMATYRVVGLAVLSGDGSGTLNYATGVFSATFNASPAAQVVIYDKYIAYQGNRPQGVLFFENQFTFMPVPDQVYQILMQGFINPVQLALPADTPVLPEWGPCISYGMAVEIFNDRGDDANAKLAYGNLKRYENIALARTIQQYTPMQGVGRF